MKKNIMIGLISLIVLAGGSLGTIGAVKKDYELIDDNFITEVAVDDDLNYTDMYIIESNSYGSKEIPVTRDMIVEGDNTSSAGKKTLVIKYSKQEFLVEYIVKYRVKFMVGDEVISTQMILNTDELQVPEDPKLAGNEFLGWTPEIPEIIKKNIVFEADFTDKPQEVPGLKPVLAVYGDKLKDITLPSNSYGAWKFVDDLDSTVGNAGTNKFNVKFYPTNTELKIIDGEVTINVDKKELEFKNLVTEFAYDGKPHKPKFDLDVNVKVEYFGPNPSEIGSYVYTLEIIDDNYKGYYAGNFEIVKPTVTIYVNSYTINLGDSLPVFEWNAFLESDNQDEISKFDSSVLGVKVIKPNVVQAGKYTLTVSWTNSNYNVRVVEGELEVKKVSFDDEGNESLLVNPTISAGIYGDELSTVEIENINPNGTWSWKEPSTILTPEDMINNPTIFVTAVFTPNDLNNYEIVERELLVKVTKKELRVVVLQSEFDYDYGVPKYVTSQVEDGSYTDVETVIVYQDKNIKDHPSNAGSYYCTVKIDDARYSGQISCNLVINKINPTLPDDEIYGEAFFSNEFNDIKWNTYLSDIKLPKGYSFNTPLNVTLSNGKIWENPTDQLTIIDELMVAATYTPEDTVNFNSLNGAFKVKVNKLQAAIKGVSEIGYTMSYNGEVHTLTGVYSTHDEIELIYTYKLNGIVVESLLNAGEYEVIISIPETEHYFAAESITTTVTILKSDVALPSGDFSATFEDTLGSLKSKLPTSEYGTWSWEEGDAALVGPVSDNANIHYAVFTPNEENENNFNSFKHAVPVTVMPKQLFITIIDSEFEYNGEAQYVQYEIKDTKGVPYSTDDITVSNSDRNLTNVGNETFVLQVNENNYYSTQVAVTLTITPIVITRPTADLTVFNYNGEEQTYKLAENEYYTISNNVQTNAGTYKVIVSLNLNYTWDDGTNSELTFDFVINKAVYAVETPTLTATYGQTLAEVKLPESDYGVWKWNDVTTTYVGSAGNQVFKATFKVNEEEGLDNYFDSVYELTIIVNKREVTEPTAFVDRIYNGSVILPYITIPEDFRNIYEYRIENENSIDAGIYYVVFTIIDSNYKWETTNESDIVVSYNILKAQSNIVDITIPDWAYGEEANVPTVSGEFVKNVLFTYSTTEDGQYTAQVPTNAGTYYVKATVEGTNNYEGSSSIKEFTINKKTIDKPSVRNITYDGEYHYSSLENTDLYEIVEDNGGFKVGEYQVIIRLKDSVNYEWNGTLETLITLTYKILESSGNDWLEQPSVENQYTYGEFTTIGSATAIYGDVIVEYRLETSNEYTTIMPTVVGRYFVRFTVLETSDYNGLSEELAFEIIKDQVQKPVADETRFVYDGSEKVYGISSNAYYTVSNNLQTNANETGYDVTVSLNDTVNYEWADGTTDNLSFTFVIEKQTVTAPSDTSVVYTGKEFTDGIELNDLYLFESVTKSDVGIYNIPVTLKDSANYKWDSTEGAVHTVKFEITPAQVQITGFDITSITYGETLVPSGSTNFGNVVFKYATAEDGEYSEEVPTNAGTYYVKAVVLGTSIYIGFETVPREVKINPIIVTKPTADLTKFTYNGEEQTYKLQLNETVYTVLNNKQTNKGVYIVTVTLIDRNNYCWDDNTNGVLPFTFEILQVTNEWTNGPTMNGWTYGDSGVAGTAVSKFGTVNVEYIDENGLNSKTLPTTAGQYTAKFTVEGNTNYTELVKEIPFTIAKKVVEAPTIESKIYTGSTLIADIEATSDFTVKTNEGGITVGNYDVILTLVDSINYKWDNTEEADKIFTFAITKAQAEISNLKIVGWAYLEETKEPTATTTFGTIVYTYIINEVEGLNAPTLPGTYTVKATVEATENFDGDVAETTVTITKAVYNVPSIESKSYTGEIQTSGLTI